MEKKNQRIRRLWATAVLSVLLAAILGGCGAREKTGEPQAPSQQPAEESTAGDPIEVETPVGRLTFPKELSAGVRSEQTNESGHYGVSFYSKVGEEEVFLFEFHICDEERGYRIGSVPDAQGNRQQIWVEISGIDTKEGWSEQDVKRVNLQQSCVNDLTEQLRQLDGFEE